MCSLHAQPGYDGIRKVVLIEPRAPGFHVFSKFKLPRLGLPLLGAVLVDKGIEVKIYVQEVAKIDWGEVATADLVGISTVTPTAPVAYDLIERIKASSDIPVVLGGPHVSFLADEALAAGADFVVRGEGEETFVELIEQLSAGEGELSDIEGLSYHDGDGFRHNPDRERVKDLTALPWPDLTLIEGFERFKVIPLQTSRGCPYDCKFCSVTSMFGRRYRFRDTDDVIAELEVLCERQPNRTVFFYDDNFTASPSHTKELLRKMKEKGLTQRWMAQARVEVVEDLELMELMRDTNCKNLFLGVESINPATLEAFRKSQTVDDIRRAVEVLHQYKIRVHGMFVLGSDEDDKQTIRDTVRFARKSGIDTVQFLVLTPLPGTETYDELCSEGRIFVDDWSKFSGHHVVYEPAKMSPFKLQKEIGLKAMRRFYSVFQCWKLGMSFRWKDMAISIYAHHTITRWKSMNRYYISELKHRYKAERQASKAEKAHRKQEQMDRERLELPAQAEVASGRMELAGDRGGTGRAR
ncbi:MAG: B12-binding domain-containing radical SAM protein [Actinobacteria bacterium]|nr:B12-binding domain-containing radical SAM protein [Actinomycetota bacterium]MBU2688706.1 B12-binding domain-containing radical SAM protein [Actinomycetota bacterium]